MMKRTLTALPLIAVMTFGANATEITPYASVRIGLGAVSADAIGYNLGGTSLGLAFGGKITLTDTINARGEFEIGMGSFAHEKRYYWNGRLEDKFNDELSMTTFMLNAYVDFLTDSRIRPFVGVGLGMSRNSIEFRDRAFSTVTGALLWDVKDEFSDTSFIWALHGGVGFNITERWNMDVGIRYSSTEIHSNTFNIVQGMIGFTRVF